MTAAANDNATARDPRVGAMYQATRGESATQIAARIRRWIKDEVKAGRLPVAAYSVRTRYASMMQAIDIKVDLLPFCTWQLTEGPERWGDHLIAPTPAAKQVRDALQAQLDLYNDQRSDKHPHYFGSANLGDEDERNALYDYEEQVRRGALDRAQPALPPEVA